VQALLEIYTAEVRFTRKIIFSQEIMVGQALPYCWRSQVLFLIDPPTPFRVGGLNRRRGDLSIRAGCVKRKEVTPTTRGGKKGNK